MTTIAEVEHENTLLRKALNDMANERNQYRENWLVVKVQLEGALRHMRYLFVGRFN